MKKFISLFMGNLIIPFIAMLLLPGCDAIEGIFKAGVWTGIFLVALVIAVIVFIISRMFKK